jgi:hypothetical protein
VTGSDGKYEFTQLVQEPEGTLEVRTPRHARAASSCARPHPIKARGCCRDRPTQATKGGFEGFDDTFAIKDRLPRFDVMLAPSMSPGSLRFVLSWAQKPSDLDIHLVTPSATPCTVSYTNKHCKDDKQNAQLDVDVTSGYGPETITIVKPMDGTYRFYVHMFTTDQIGWQKSQAVVRVLHKRTNGQLTIHTYNVFDSDAYFTSAAFNPAGPKLDSEAATARYWNVR